MNEHISTSGLLEIATELARIKAAKNAFSIYDADDISQEIWLAVNKVAPSFDPARLPPGKRALSFFNFISENILRNLKRDTKEVETVSFEDAPVEVEDSTLAGEVRAREMYSFIMDRMPDKLKASFEELVMCGDSNLSSYVKTQIRQAAALALLEFYDERQ